MNRVRLGAAFPLLLLLLVPSLPGDGTALKVPRGPAAVIDGRIDSAEWRGAAVERLPNGLTVWLQHDGKFLSLAVSSGSQGFPSVCAVQGDTVRVLHASAALGSVAYVGSGDDWTRRDTAFVYEMRSPDTTPTAREERRAYLARHRWVASTFRMGGGQAHEFHISLGLLDSGQRAPRIAIGYFRTEGAQVAWPDSLVSAGEGCADLTLIRGYVPVGLRFRPETYVELDLE